MRILAKFKCDSITADFGEQVTLRMSAVTTGSEENKSFSKWTPSGQVVMTISNETPASKFFEPGKEYYLTFQEADYPLDIK